MMTYFINQRILFLMTIMLIKGVIFSIKNQHIPDARPPLGKRTYHSDSIDHLVNTLQPLFIDEDIGALFANCLPNTLDTTVAYFSMNKSPLSPSISMTDTFIVTGDIHALWLRDSTNQVIPYLPYATENDENLQNLVEGLINRQALSILVDPYANAFNYNYTTSDKSNSDGTTNGHESDQRIPPMNGWIFEGKYEIDSLCAFLKLSYWYYYYGGSNVLFRFAKLSWFNAVERIVDSFAIMQDSNDVIFSSNDGENNKANANDHNNNNNHYPTYEFQRYTMEGLDTLIMKGRGPPGKPSGMSRSFFRPSDDVTTFPYNIPGNAMAYVELQHTIILLESILKLNLDNWKNNKCKRLLNKVKHVAASIHLGLQPYFIDEYSNYEKKTRYQAKSDHIELLVNDQQLPTIRNHKAKQMKTIPYEVDGYGNELYMDDANIPSLLALPLIGYVSIYDPVYINTRKYILSSETNPYYFISNISKGVGSPHTGLDYVWPMSIIAQAFTSDMENNNNIIEIMECLYILLNSSKSVGKGLLHESFHKNNMSDYTRLSFAWVNGFFGELILYLIQKQPSIIIKSEFISLAQSVIKPTVHQTILKETEFLNKS